MERVDVVVAGCGVVGLACAWQLVRRGLKVAAVDRGRFGQGTSATSFAWANASTKTAFEPYHRLNAAGLAGYNALAAEHGAAAIGLHGRGSLQWAPAGNDLLAGQLQDAYETLRGWNYPVEWLDRVAIAARWPALLLVEDMVGLFCGTERWVDLPCLLAWLAADFRRLGGVLLENRPIAAVRRDGGRIAAIETAAGEIETGRLLIAAGIDTPKLAALATGDATLAEEFPLQVSPGFLVETTPVAAAKPLDVLLWAADEDGLHLQPSPRGGLLLGAGDIDDWVGDGDRPAVIEKATAALVERARGWLPALETTGLTASGKVGRRPMPADGYSILGPLAEAPGAWVAVTHSGVTLALEIGRLLAEEIATGDMPAALAPFRPGRFAL
jgi:glycine/D-amino acid oxidase-like deaminating enzyme